MSIDIEAKMIYGLRYADVPEEMRDDIDTLLEYGDIEYASPWYDSVREYWIIGVEINVNAMTPEEMKYALDDAWEEIPRMLKDCGDIDLYVSAHVS